MTKKPILVSVGPDFSLSAASVDLNLRAHTVQFEENVPPSATVTNEAAYFAGGNAVTTDFTYTGVYNGSAFSDRMIGDDLGNGFNGGAGNDFLRGGAGRDILSGDDGNDFITGGTGDDLLFGGLGNDTINGGDGNDSIRGSDGDDTINGGAGDDIIRASDDSNAHGSPGRDTVNGGAGNDTITAGRDGGVFNGGAGNDTITGSEGNDTINGGAGNDTLYGDKTGFNANSTDTIHGGAGDDYIQGDSLSLPSGRVNFLFGDAGNDTITSFLGDDTINGGSGNDIIDGGKATTHGNSGSDTMTGGAGNDTFVFHSEPFHGRNYLALVDGQHDVITDFKHGQDKIDLSDTNDTTFLQNVNFSSAQSALDYLHAQNLSVTSTVVKVICDADGTLISFSDDAGTLELNVSIGATAAAHITQSDFLF